MKKKPKTIEQKKAEIEFYPVQKMDSPLSHLDLEKFQEEKKKLKDSLSINQSILEKEYEEIKFNEVNEFMRTMLPKGKYDIDYVINLLGIIIDNCGPLSSILSIKESCKKLKSNLLIEKCPVHQDPRICVTCPLCKEHAVLPKSISHHWKCPCTKNTKLLD